MQCLRIAVIVLLLPLVFLCSSSARSDPLDQPPAARPVRAVPSALAFFAPIREGDLVRLEETLVLSEPQRAALDRFFAVYTERIAELGPEISRITDIFYERRSLQDPEAELEATVAMYAGAEEIRRRMIEHESELFWSMEPLLSEEQAKRMPLIERWRDRVRFAVGLDSLPGARLDLVGLVESLNLEAGEAADAWQVIEDYEIALTSLLKRRHDAAVDRIIRGARHQTEWAAAERPYDDEFVRQRRRILTPRVQIDTQLRSLNHATLLALVGVFSAENGRRLTNLADAMVYPSCFPDRHIEEARSTFRRVLDVESLDEELRHDLEARLAMFEVQYDRLRRSLDDEVFRFQSAFQATLHLDADEAAEHDEFVREVRLLRQALAERTVQTIVSLLSDDQLEMLRQRDGQAIAADATDEPK